MKKKFDEWAAIWIVFGILACTTLFQMIYISHLKSELKLFQNDAKNTDSKSGKTQ